MYQALYRKWRPKVFEDVVSQGHIVDTIKNQIVNNRIAHAYLFCGSRGTGKTSTAKIFARAINCKNSKNGNPCNECEACKGILNGSNLDVIEIDAASNNGVDNVREIRDEIIYPPTDVKYKVYIIDEVHMLSTQAFNALLKTLEEPPKYVVFILATTELHKVPATILSRCQKFDFKRITYRDTAYRLGKVVEADGIKIDRDGINLLAKAADGSLRDALSILDQCVALGKETIQYNDIATLMGASLPDFQFGFADSIIDEDLGKALEYINQAVANGIDVIRLCEDTIEHFRNLMIIKTSKDPQEILDVSEVTLESLLKQADRVMLNKILTVIEELFNALNYAKYVSNPKTAVETVILKVASKQTNKDINSILNRLEIIEDKINNRTEMIPVYKNVTAEFINNINIKEPVVDFKEEIELIEKKIEEISEAQENENEVQSNEIDDSPVENEEQDYINSFEDMLVEDYTENTLNAATETEENTSIEENINIEENTSIEENTNIEENDTQESTLEESITEDNQIQAQNDEQIDFPAFLTEPIQSQEEPQINDMQMEDTPVVNEELNKNIENIILNIPQAIEAGAKNADFAFEEILRRAKYINDNGTLVLSFKESSFYKIAKNSHYDSIIADAIKEVFGIEIKVTITEKKKEAVKKEDPLDELLFIAKDNEITFNIE